MPKYVTENQMTGDGGESFASYVITSRVKAVFRATSRRDTGVDGEIELTTPCDQEKRIATGTFLKAQIKSTTTKQFDNDELSIQLDETDKNYFTSEMNVPGVVLYADLQSTPHELYWAEIIPTDIQNDGVVRVQKKNRVCADTCHDFARICRIQTRVKMQSALKAMAKECFETLMERILPLVNKEEKLRYVVSDFAEDIDAIKRTFQLTLAGGLKAREIAEYRNMFEDAVEFEKLCATKVAEIDRVLADNGLPSYSSLVAD